MWRRVLKWSAIGLFISLAGIFLLGFVLYFSSFFAVPDFSRISDTRETSIILDEQGQAIREYCTYCREIITLEELGYFSRLAVLVEDYTFWERRVSAFSIRSLIRAAWQNFIAMNIQQGGSTITQQTARLLFLGKELAAERETESSFPRYWRKAREAWVAALLDRHFAHDRAKILELYLNNVYCGHGRFGVKSCSGYYFDKSPRDLTIPEAAMLIGTWRSPRSSPFKNLKDALRLRNRVLQQLRERNEITDVQKNEFEQVSLPSVKDIDRCRGRAFAAFVRNDIVTRRRFADQGLRVHTTLNCTWQLAVSQALAESLRAMRDRNPELVDLWGAALMIDRRSGAIKVWAQEPREVEYSIHQIKRHAGSAFKPFLYGLLLERGWRLSCEDAGSGPCMLNDSYDRGDGKSMLAIPMGRDREPKYIQNFPYPPDSEIPRYRGMIPAILAIAESRNVATESPVSGVRNSGIAHRVTREEILEFAARLGVTVETVNPAVAAQKNILLVKKEVAERLGLPPNTIRPNVTIAIGSIEVSLYEMVRAWTGFLGGLINPYAIEEIEDAMGASLEATEIKLSKKVLGKRLDIDQPHDPEERNEYLSYAITRALRAAVEYQYNGRYVGTGKSLLKEVDKETGLDFPVMGKTGTATNDAGETTDNWFVGCSPSYCMGVWMGRKNKSPMKSTLDPNDPAGKRLIQETGGKNAIPVFKAMRVVYEGRPKELFPEITDPNKPFISPLQQKLGSS